MERWRFPIRFGIGFMALQLMVFVIRFGLDGFPISDSVDLIRLDGPVSGLVLFFLGGVLAGLFVQRLLRDATGAWRRFLIGGIAVATPLAVLFSLAGGLLGPPVIIINAVVPYVVLVGIPAAVRTIWLRMAGATTTPAP